MTIIKKNKKNEYCFPLGTAIPYQGKDGDYILVALTELNTENEAHTKMSEYENTLMKIWREVNRVYAKFDLVFPILGAGITRFDDYQYSISNLLRCMLCTLNTSKLQFKSKITIVIFNNDKNVLKDLSLYEFKNLFKIIN